jgi:hypothetical protein
MMRVEPIRATREGDLSIASDYGPGSEAHGAEHSSKRIGLHRSLHKISWNYRRQARGRCTKSPHANGRMDVVLVRSNTLDTYPLGLSRPDDIQLSNVGRRSVLVALDAHNNAL